MATVRLVASTYSVSNNTVKVSDPSNMYTNTDSDTYATATHTSASTSSYYVYLKGFNFGAVPTGAEVTSFTVKLKARETGLSTSSNYRPRLVNNTTTITGSSSTIGTTASVITFTGVTATWATISGYGANFGIRINTRRSNSGTQGYAYIYGAEIEVTYAEPRTITSTLTGDGTIDPSGAVTINDGETYVLAIMPTNSSDTVTATNNGSDVTSQLVLHSGTESISQVPSSTFTTGFSNTSGAFYQNSSTTSTAWLEYAIGHSAESPYSTSNTSNTYVKPEGSTGWINYTFDFSDIPSSATINSVSVKVYGARENATVDSTHVARFQCYSGSTAKGTIQNFTSTSNGSVTVSDVGTWTASELHNAQLRFELGYYGGRMLGITWTVNYTADPYYTYSYTVSGNATIAVVIGGGGQTETMYIKVNGSWVTVSAVYKKVNGAWVAQSNLSSLFSTTTKYVKGA